MRMNAKLPDDHLPAAVVTSSEYVVLVVEVVDESVDVGLEVGEQPLVHVPLRPLLRILAPFSAAFPGDLGPLLVSQIPATLL